MSKLGILGATALSLSVAFIAPAMAGPHGGGGGGGMRGGTGGGMHMGGGPHMGGGGMQHMGNGGAFRGAQASVAAAPVNSGNSAARGNFAGRPQFAQGGFQGGRDHDGGWRHHGRGGLGFVAGLAAGSALGYGYGYGYGPYYYGDDYAYDNYYDSGYPAEGVVVSGGVDPAYCAQRYRSYDPASGTYLGYDGLRHPCGE